MQWTVYLLIDPRNGDIRYVGSSKHAKHRFMRHLWESSYCYCSSARSKWIKELLDSGNRPGIEILSVYDSERKMVEAELTWDSTPKNGRMYTD